jgi:hypothetical protein
MSDDFYLSIYLSTSIYICIPKPISDANHAKRQGQICQEITNKKTGKIFQGGAAMEAVLSGKSKLKLTQKELLDLQ